jgi:pentatricopeptide repeat protein
MQFIENENITTNSNSLVDNVALSMITGLGYYILKRITGENKLKNAKENLNDNLQKLEDSKNLNLYRNYVTEENRDAEPTLETYKEILKNLNLKQNEELTKEISEQEILNLFNELKQRNLTADLEMYNLIMTVLLGAHKFTQAIDIFEELLVDNHEPNTQTILNLLKIHKFTVHKKNDATNKNDRLNKFDEIFNTFSAKRLPEATDAKTLNELLEALMNCNKYAPVEKIFNNTLNSQETIDIETFSIMIKSFSQENKFDQAYETLEKMKLFNLQPTDVIYGCLLNCAVKCSKFDQIKKIWEEMKEKSIEPNTIIYSILIKAYNKMKLYDTALEIFEQISQEGKNSNIVIYNAILDVCVNSKNLEKLKEIYEYIKTMSNICPNFPKPNLITYSTIIKGFAKNQKMQDALELYETLKTQEVELDEVLFNTLIDGFARIGDDKQAIKIYEEAKAYGIKGSAIIYSILIKMYCKINDINSATLYFNLYKNEKHKATIVPYSTMIQMYIKRKELDKAIVLFEEIKKRGMKPDQVSYNFIINGCSFNKKLEKAIEYLHESFKSQVKLSDDTYKNILEYLLNNKFMKANERAKNISEISKILKEKNFEIPYEQYSKLMKVVYSANESKVTGNQRPVTSRNKFDMKKRA